jgi:Family of unknown function (DUF6178)
MSKRADLARRDRHDSESTSALARLIGAPHLAQVVSRLSPDVLHQVIRHHGLEACGALVAAATPQQVTAILDLDLWRPAAAGGTEQFDAGRFGAWLEALMEEGEAVAARVIADMDESLAVAALSRYVRVFDPGIFEPTFSSDDEQEPNGPRPTDDSECEVGGYVIRARTADTWDAIVGLLMALSDEREQRRTEQGYLSAEDARAFLTLARQPRRGPSPAANPIAAAYFRDLKVAQDFSRASIASTNEPGPPDDHTAAVSDADIAASLDAVADVMAEAGIAPTQPRALLGPASANVTRLTPLEPLMEYVFAAHPAVYLSRNQELTFLANALLAGCSVYGRAFTIQEAWDAAVGVCNVGLDRGPLPDAFLVEHDLIAEFEAGWRLLHEGVSLLVADELIGTLAELRTVDDEVQQDLDRLRRDLARERATGTPWRAAESLEVMSILDTPVWACLNGLLSECPVLPDAVSAILERRIRAVSATAFACFTTRAQIGRVHDFAPRLRDLLLH